MLNESGDEEEQDAIVSQVLDEIGIEISGTVSAPHQKYPALTHLATPYLHTSYQTLRSLAR